MKNVKILGIAGAFQKNLEKGRNKNTKYKIIQFL
jgi:hypothetical protein